MGENPLGEIRGVEVGAGVKLGTVEILERLGICTGTYLAVPLLQVATSSEQAVRLVCMRFCPCAEAWTRLVAEPSPPPATLEKPELTTEPGLGSEKSDESVCEMT